MHKKTTDQKNTVCFQGFPSHVGVTGNPVADLAQEDRSHQTSVAFPKDEHFARELIARHFSSLQTLLRQSRCTHYLSLEVAIALYRLRTSSAYTPVRLHDTHRATSSQCIDYDVLCDVCHLFSVCSHFCDECDNCLLNPERINVSLDDVSRIVHAAG